MSINIDNYEEYFLLYADDELSSAERNEVEVFIEQNPELKDELELFLGSKLNPSIPTTAIATTLLKLPSGISAEEAILLEADGEISPVQLKELEMLSMEFPGLHEERELIKSIRLNQADEVLFADKTILYRHESRVISMRFWKSAVAAALIGAGLFFGLDQTYRVDETELVGIQENGAVVIEDSSVQIQGSIEVESNDPLIKEGVKPEAGITALNSEPGTNAIDENAVSSNLKNSVAKLPSNPKVRVVSTRTIEQRVLENINNPQRNNQAYTPVLLQKRMEPNMAPPDEVKVDVERLTASKPLDADLTVQKNEFSKPAAVETENNSSIGHILFVDEEKVNRSKFGGFVRKVKRTIEKKTNIKMPDEVRLAGFEIPIK